MSSITQTLPADADHVRQLVMRHGWNATAYQILNPGIHYWFDPVTDAVVGFAREPGWWVIAGAPVCALADLKEVVARLESAAALEGCRVVYVCAAERMRQLVSDWGSHATATLGAEPIWAPSDWVKRMPGLKSFRAQLNRAKNKHVVIEPVALPMSPELCDDLHDCLRDWLTHRPLPPLRFLVEPNTIDGVLADRRLWVARQRDRVVAYLLASPVPARQGYLIEQIARRPDAPNGTTELIIDTAIRAMAAEQCNYVTLGMVVLSSTVRPLMDENPRWLRGLFHFARAHGRRFYNFAGLERFREKLQPDEWEPLYLITNTPRFAMRGLYAAGAAFCGDRSPLSLVGGAVVKALRTEAGWFRDWLNHDPSS